MTDQTVTLAFISAAANHNKFYQVNLRGGDVHVRYGRILDGVMESGGQRKVYPGGLTKFNSLIEAKKRKGYKVLDLADGNPKNVSGNALFDASLRAVTKEGDTTDPRVKALVKALVDSNAHDIAMASGGKITVSDGAITTALGVVSRSSLDRADIVLSEISKASSHIGKVSLLEEYLTLVPQKVGARRGWEESFLTESELARQATFVSQLRDSLSFMEKQQQVTTDSKLSFRYNLAPIDDTDPRFLSTDKAFRKTSNAGHRSAQYKLKAMYQITDLDVHQQAYNAALAAKGNERWLWHGSMASNILSILASGFYIADASAKHVTARMFGSGIYLSNQSTKSLNYSGGFWAGKSLSNSSFMFSTTAVMGNSYEVGKTENGRQSYYHKFHQSHDSINVKPGHGGVINHEAIVWNLDQISLRYLCEFSL